MARIKIVDRAAILSTELTTEDIKRAKAICPETLYLEDADGNITFGVSTTKNGESVIPTRFGLSFEEGRSTIVTTFDCKGDVTRELIEKLFGATILNLLKVEDQVLNTLDRFSADLVNAISIDTEEEEALEESMDAFEEAFRAEPSIVHEDEDEDEN